MKALVAKNRRGRGVPPSAAAGAAAAPPKSRPRARLLHARHAHPSRLSLRALRGEQVVARARAAPSRAPAPIPALPPRVGHEWGKGVECSLFNAAYGAVICIMQQIGSIARRMSTQRRNVGTCTNTDVGLTWRTPPERDALDRGASTSMGNPRPYERRSAGLGEG